MSPPPKKNKTKKKYNKTYTKYNKTYDTLYHHRIFSKYLNTMSIYIYVHTTKKKI